ncbi:MAG: DUF1887 family CARF protein, partial [Clostridiales bacterium]|nr:DUF1887 family CARF protein [Clostridiales bacterium]
YNIDLKGAFYPLERDGLIAGSYRDKTTFRFWFKDEQVKRCLSKAGTILELYIYLMASELTQKDGSRYYTDEMIGVFIDWDGVVHDETDFAVDTENEIDVVLMRGLVPVFISCKNGAVGEDELYKLRSVADRFGSAYAKRVLVGTTFGRGKTSKEYLLERAKDMNVQVIEGVHEMTEEELKKRLRELA